MGEKINFSMACKIKKRSADHATKQTKLDCISEGRDWF